MARVQVDQDLVPSVLDRLTDLEPGASSELPLRRHVRLKQIKEAVKQDLEFLFNSRTLHCGLPEGLQHLHNSLLTFGLPDFTTMSLNRASDQQTLLRAVEVAIRTFEPRLKDVKVAPVELREFDRGLRFRIDAMLIVKPAADEAVTFDSVVDLSNKAFVVQID